jgi:membrane fusion protein (multidrug efflux system)
MTSPSLAFASVTARCRPSRAVLLVWLAVSAAVGACSKKEAPSKPPPPVVVQTVKVRGQPFARSLEAIGSLRSVENTLVTAEIGGKVVFLDVPEGREVKRGHVLARLDASINRAELSIARARVEGAKTTLERSEALARERLISEQQLDEAEVARETARGELARTRAAVDKTVVRAPFSGTVGLREVSLGAFVAPGTPITRITNTKALEIVFSVPERHVADLAVGQNVHGIVGSCNNRFSGKVTVVDPAVDPVTLSVRVQASILKEEGVLKPGMSARLRLEIAQQENAIVIPEEALIRAGTETRVFVVENQKAANRQVVPGDFRTGMVEIRSGLKPGDVVITRGHQRLRPGASVTPKEHEPVKNPNLALGKADASADCWF